MINLVPHEGTKLIRREYIVRVAAVWCLLLAAAIAGSAVLLVPTYVLVSKQFNAMNEATADSGEVEQEYSKLFQELGASRSMIDQLMRVTERVPSSEIIRHIEYARGKDVNVDTIEIVYRDATPRIIASGNAATREALRGFVDTLKHDGFFMDASIPVSDLAKDVQPTFTVTLTLRDTPQTP